MSSISAVLPSQGSSTNIKSLFDPTSGPSSMLLSSTSSSLSDIYVINNHDFIPSSFHLISTPMIDDAILYPSFPQESASTSPPHQIQIFDGFPVSVCSQEGERNSAFMTSCEIVPCEPNFSKSINMDTDDFGDDEFSKSINMDTDDFGDDELEDEPTIDEDLSQKGEKSINMDTDEVGHQESKSINMDSSDTTTDVDIKDDVSVSTLDISLCQAYEEIFGDGDVPNMVVPPTTDLFQQPFHLQSSEYEVDFIPPLDIQFYQAYEEIFGDHDVFTMLPTSDEGIFHQPFHPQPDEHEVEFDIGQGHESKRTENGEHQSSSFTFNAVEDSAFLSFTICHDLGEINQVDGETHPGPDGETHLKDMINQIDGETHLCNKDICKQEVDGETHLHKIDHKPSHCLGHDIGLENFFTSSSASNGDPYFLGHLLRDRSTSAFSPIGYAHGKGIYPLFTMINILIWL
ncbi:hypothetical protein ACA910_009723 [Epithemia clementina (nom. ined.)]